MAEIMVNLFLGKLADEAVQEALSLYGVRDKVEEVERQLKCIQVFLKDADTKRHKDERVKQWVKEVLKVGDLIEDVLDMLLNEVGGGKPEDLPNMPMNLISKHKLGSEIDKIQQRICEITENRKKYNIEELKETSSTGASVMLPTRPFIHRDIDELEVVRFEVDKKTIVNQLIDTNITRQAVITIVGVGGSGKTTLAKYVYKSSEVKHHFDISIWLTISQDYKLISTLKKLLKEFGSESWNEEEEYLITELNKCMGEKKYLVVLDDVWSSDVWTQLEVALPNANNGSRALLTTRFVKIAEEADIISKPHEMKPLTEEEGKQLLLKKIFPNQFANECPNDLLPLATQITKKFSGWPLPLVVVGGILSSKNPDYITWHEVMQKMDWQTDGSSFMDIISTSYEDLPVALKPCFMYLGVFPKDYQIKVTTLIQLWIAEGFVRQDGTTKLLEDIAESYLEELVQRCMVQVSRRSCIDKIKYCHIHDLQRDLAIQKAKEDNFLTIVSNNDNKHSYGTYDFHALCRSRGDIARRVALHNYGNNEIAYPGQKNIRSLINFEDVPNFDTFGMLQVLHMGTALDYDLYGIKCMNGLNALTALKYFRLEGDVDFTCTFPADSFFHRFPLTYLKNPQTVCTLFCKCYGELPRSFWDNKQLRHIYLSSCYGCEVIPEGPPSATDLPSLLTLKGVRARQDWVVELPNFPYIRKLGIDLPEDVEGEPLINLLSNLKHLGSLHLECSNEKPMTFPDCISAFSDHNHLYSFSLEAVDCRWPGKEVVDCALFPPHLVKLTLRYIDFEEDPMPQLEKLPNLKVLKLSRSTMKLADGKQMICSLGGFGRLQELKLNVNNLEEWEIEEGAMPILNQLKLHCHKLLIVPDLQYLINLQEFTVNCDLKYLSHCLQGISSVNQFKSRLRGEDQWKIKHIPSVIIIE